MESSLKRRTGFIKGKLVKSLYRSAAPTEPSSTTSPANYFSSEDTSPRTVYHLQLHHHHHQPKDTLVPFNPNNTIALSSTFIVNKDQAAAPQKTKVSYYIPTQSNGTNSTGTNYNYAKMVDKYYGDESVDMKAAHYIACVQERFRSLELTC
ncbi:hypothetical protein P3S67_025637 [Capsicum chacoense]